MSVLRMKTRGFCALLVVLFLLLCSGTAPAGTKKNVRVKLLAFNDFHGQLSPKTVSGRPAGGASVLASYLKKAQAGMEDRTFIVIAGDSIGASPVNSALLQDEPSVMFLNTLANGYCSDRMSPRCNMVATVGNHEFDEGATELKRMLYGGNHAKGPFLENPYTGAHYPVVAANVVEAATGKPLLKPYVVKKAGNVRIAFIGAVVREAPSMVAPGGVAGLSFIDEAEAINRYIPEIKAKGIKAVVAVIHQGGSDVNGLAGRLDGEIDVVVSGHTHELIDTTAQNRAGKPVLVTQSGNAGTAYADVDLEIDPKTKDIVKKSATLNPTWGDAGPGLNPDPAVTALVKSADEAVRDDVSEVVGTAREAIVRTQNGSGESPLGNLIADAQRLHEKTDFAFTNPGGIRTDIAAGEVTWGELFAVQPFGNPLVRMTLTGQQIHDVLAQQWTNPASPRMLQVSGLAYRWSYNGPEAAGTITEVLKDGKPIDKAATYTVTVNEFLAQGGDSFTVFKSGLGQVVDAPDIDVLVSYVRSLPQPFGTPAGGRIERTDAPSVK